MTPVPFFTPDRIAADARDAQFSRKTQMFGELIAVHITVRLKPDTTSAGDEFLDAIEQDRRHAGLALKRQALDASRTNDRHLVRLDLKS